MEKIVSLCKRRGFIFPGSEIYGGLSGTWDYGPLGVELKNNVKREWWCRTVDLRDDVVGIETAILMNGKVWQASGHAEHFTDPMVDCKSCKRRFKADELKRNDKCPECGGELTPVRPFNMMFKTFVGPVEDTATMTYLRPETAQGMFVNFKNVVDSLHLKLPFGIAQIGKSFRNEITPGNFVFRSREFEQMELEFFVKPGEDDKWFDFWRRERYQWFLDLGIRKENIKLVDIPKENLAHYSKATTEVHYKFPFLEDFGELEGIANRTDYDLRRQAEFSGQGMAYYEEETKEKFVPCVIEPSLGVERALLAFLLDAYYEEEAEGETRVFLKLHPKLAPIKVGVFPLLANKEKLVKKAREIYEGLKPEFLCAWDDIGNIGKRYRRQDEIGTPWCVTVDFQTLEDDTVTLRDRDTMKQERIKIGELAGVIKEKLA